MILLVDIGNTRLKWAEYADARLGEVESARHDEVGMATVLEQRWRGLRKPERVVVANVGGEHRAEAVVEWTRHHWALKPEFVRAPPHGDGVINAYTKPDRLGADRWAALVGLRHRVDESGCVVDCGTAITIDALAADGHHLGGIILPGLAMMRSALVEETSGLPEASDGEVALLARDTRDAISGGTLYTMVALIDRVAADLEQELGSTMARVITGGDAPRVLSLLARDWIHAPDLVLEGLAVTVRRRKR